MRQFIMVIFFLFISCEDTKEEICIDESNINPDAVCPEIFDPVLGCDEQIYSNSCEAEKNGVRFKFNSYFPIRSLNLMRGVLVAEEDNIKNYYIDSIFNTIWQDGLNMNDETIIQKVLKNLNVNPKTFALRSTSSLIKDYLRKKTSDAYQKGIFGAPTFVANNRIFWGQDRIEFVLSEAKK